METLENHPETKILLHADAETRHERDFALRSRELRAERAKVRISEITLHPRSGMELTASDRSLQCLLPVVGNFKLKTGLEVQLGEIWSQGKEKGDTFSVTNSISSESVHFVRLEFMSSSFFPETFSPFLPDTIENRIQPIIIHKSREEYIRISLGAIGGRREVEFSTYSSSLAFVISGALEYQNRLIEQGDSLWIGGAADLEMESLAEESLILILEVDSLETKSVDSLLN